MRVEAGRLIVVAIALECEFAKQLLKQADGRRLRWSKKHVTIRASNGTFAYEIVEDRPHSVLGRLVYEEWFS